MWLCDSLNNTVISEPCSFEEDVVTKIEKLYRSGLGAWKG